MTPFRASSSAPRRLIMAVMALLVLMVALPAGSALAASGASPALEAARAAATPVIPPPKPKPKPFTCTVSKKKLKCVRTKQSCTRNKATKTTTCKVTTVRCRLDKKLKRCVLTTSRCSTATKKDGKKAKRRCRQTYVKKSNTRFASLDTTAAVPRFVMKAVARARGLAHADDIALVSSTKVPPAAVLDDAGPQVSTGRAGAGVGILILAFAGLWLIRSRRRPRSGS
jgi:hypothetical protein